MANQRKRIGPLDIPSKCCFCGQPHSPKQLCKERLEAFKDQFNRKSDTKRKGWRQ